MTGRNVRFGAVVMAAFLALPAFGWNGAGHRLVAAIAWERMTPEARETAGRLLRQHPDHARWLKRGGEQAGERGAFIEASTWPDDIRKDSRFYSADKEEPTPTLPGFPDMERRSDWHYVNIPLDGAPGSKPLSGSLDRQLEATAVTLGRKANPELERIYALPWLIHLVGDAHQPLHTSARKDGERRWDKLGYAHEVSNPFNARKPTSSLHAFWDDLPGPPWLRGDRLDAAAEALMAAHFPEAHATPRRRWIEESWRQARENGYPAGYPAENGDAPVTISDGFYRTSRAIAERRIAQAGYRLADLLNRLFDPSNQR